MPRSGDRPVVETLRSPYGTLIHCRSKDEVQRVVDWIEYVRHGQAERAQRAQDRARGLCGHLTGPGAHCVKPARNGCPVHGRWWESDGRPELSQRGPRRSRMLDEHPARYHSVGL